MGYRLGFDGATTSEVDQLLRHIERNWNHLGIRGQAGTDSTGASTASGVDCTPQNVCPDTPHTGHGPAAVAAAVVAAAIVYVVVKSSANTST
jgi:hypothetical protein